MIYVFLFRLLHFIADVIDEVYYCVKSVKRKLLSLFRTSSRYIFFVTGYPLVRQPTSLPLQRIPKHIGLLVVEELVSFSDLATIVVWCSAMGIAFISIYDHDGLIKKNKKEFYRTLLEKQMQDKSSENYKSFHVNGSASTNGYKKSEVVTINLLSQKDGQAGLVQAAYSACSAVAAGSKKAAEIAESFTDYIQTCHNMPDPDLLVRFGMVDSTLGFLPWHIRLTEIMHLRSHHKISHEEFLDTIYKFNCCQQRLGK